MFLEARSPKSASLAEKSKPWPGHAPFGGSCLFWFQEAILLACGFIIPVSASMVALPSPFLYVCVCVCVYVFFFGHAPKAGGILAPQQGLNLGPLQWILNH